MSRDEARLRFIDQSNISGKENMSEVEEKAIDVKLVLEKIVAAELALITT